MTSIQQASQLLKISRNIANRYLQSIDGFYSKVFECKVTLALIGSNLVKKRIKHRNNESDTYPILCLPGGYLQDLTPHLI